MWKYKCKSQFFTLLGAFVAGFLLAVFYSQNDVFQQLMRETLPASAVSQFTSSPILLGISGGLGVSGLVNVFLIGNMLSSYYSGSIFLFMLVVIMIPDYAILIGIITEPIMMIVCLYGWLSLSSGLKRNLKAANITGDDEIVRIYQLHHQLDPKYQQMAVETRKTVFKINLAYSLGLTAVFCVLFFMDSLMMDLIMIFICMFAFQYLARLRASSFNAISSLLVTDCNPEACASALIYYGEKRGHYKLTNRALFAQCLIYMNEPELAQDVLIAFQKSTPNNIMAYWSLMGYIYYMLKDENGLSRSIEELKKVRPQMGTMGMMVRSEELASLQNKLNLMRGDFNTCKKYFLNLLQCSPSNLQKADCDYYIALISFVQEDYVLAKMYFEKTLQNGNKLYFVRNARNYLSKIENTEDPSSTVYALEQGKDPQEQI